jgi:hypothetical protein
MSPEVCGPRVFPRLRGGVRKFGTAALADQVATQGAGHAEYGRLSGAMCWDSMLICACLAQGVNCQELQSACDSGRISISPAIMDSDSYDRVFDLETRNVTSVDEVF